MKIKNLKEYLAKRQHFAFEIKNYKEVPKCPGIYFLCAEWEDECFIHYIGSALNLRSRLHSNHNKMTVFKSIADIFAKIYVLPLSEYEYKAAEKFYIEKLRPTANKVYKKKISNQELNLLKMGVLNG